MFRPDAGIIESCRDRVALDDLAVTIMKTFNDFNADYQRESGERLFPMAHLPFWNKAEMEKEARRCIDMGLRGFVLPDTPERVGVPSFNHEYWTPFLEMIDAEGISLNFHLNAAIPHVPKRLPRAPASGYC